MFKIETSLDTKMAAAIARRQLAEEERKKRIFNPKERIYGKDYAALREQIAEKKAREYQERERDRSYINEQCRQDLLCMELDRRMKQVPPKPLIILLFSPVGKSKCNFTLTGP